MVNELRIIDGYPILKCYKCYNKVRVKNRRFTKEEFDLIESCKAIISMNTSMYFYLLGELVLAKDRKTILVCKKECAKGSKGPKNWDSQQKDNWKELKVEKDLPPKPERAKRLLT